MHQEWVCYGARCQYARPSPVTPQKSLLEQHSSVWWGRVSFYRSPCCSKSVSSCEPPPLLFPSGIGFSSGTWEEDPALTHLFLCSTPWQGLCKKLAQLSGHPPPQQSDWVSCLHHIKLRLWIKAQSWMLGGWKVTVGILTRRLLYNRGASDPHNS